MQESILFLMTYLFVFLLYELFVVRREKSGKSSRKPVEIRYLEARYQLDIKQLDYKKLLNIVSLVSAFDIALIVTLIMFTGHFVLELILGCVLTLPIIFVSYHIVGKIYQKKGRNKNV